MIQQGLKLHEGARSRTTFFANLLQDFYSDLLEQGVPEHLAALVHGFGAGEIRPDRDVKVALVVESDEQARHLAAALLEETELTVIECASAEDALAALRANGDAVKFIFVDQILAGPRDGADLVCTVAKERPGVSVVLTTDRKARRGELPADIVVLMKPWRGLDVLMAAERALMQLDADETV